MKFSATPAPQLASIVKRPVELVFDKLAAAEPGIGRLFSFLKLTGLIFTVTRYSVLQFVQNS